LSKLPFTLTFSQKRSLWEIIQDLAKSRPMNRLLQGDVGSGKTVVAALAAVVAAENGFQTAIMAPTEVLARQHFETFRKLFWHLQVADQPVLGLLTSSRTKILYADDMESEIGKVKLTADIKKGTVHIVIGTHALIQRSVKFRKLGLVVIDEQHRFGVHQRAGLAGHRNMRSPETIEAEIRERKIPRKSALNKTNLRESASILLPHFLSMSATPIPRTLMLTVFGDLDISTIDELPSGRKKILTKIVPPLNRSRAYEFIRKEIRNGRQAFVICPRIAAPEGGEPLASPSRERSGRPENFGAGTFRNQQAKLWEVKSVKEEYEKLSQKIFTDLEVAMLHGQLKPKDKEAIMKKFRDGETDVLVSTSVIEVGVDVPNATIMMIEGADRFGLAQLYQFRGRVGRGEHQSFCFLFTDSESKSTQERLQAIVQAKNGFELAEKDLQIRGPGEFLGQKQTGLPDVAMRGLQDMELIKTSRVAALKTIQTDPELRRLPLLREKISEFQARLHME
ncbi:MAG: ATP-dependent DNA helicase RecG, partial [Patescibacteria group bacterium]